MADHTNSGPEVGDTVMLDAYKMHTAPPMSKSSSGNSGDGQSIPELSPYLTLQQQTAIKAYLDGVRDSPTIKFIRHIDRSLTKQGAEDVLKAIDVVNEADTKGFEVAIETVKNGHKNILHVFTHKPILEALAQLRADSRRPAVYPIGGEQMDATRKAWEVDYIGRTAWLLRKAISQMNETRGEQEYANFVPIVQSSGTGKSRAVDELARYIFTLPFNLRPDEDKTGYPEGDLGMLSCFYPGNTPTAVELYLRYGILFENLFVATHDWVSRANPCKSPEHLARAFRAWLKTERSRFYQDIRDKTNHECLEANKQVESIKSFVLSPKETAKRLNGLVKKKLAEARERGELLIERIQAKSDWSLARTRGPKRVWLVVYFDESHPLTASRPISDDGKGFTAYQILCSTLDRFRRLDLFAIFLSTNSSISLYSPPQAAYWSSRVKDSATPGVQAPFIELPFDKYPGGKLLVENEHTLQDVCHPKHMCRFGRPLFWTRYECGDEEVRSGIVDFACMKLSPEANGLHRLDKRESRAQLAILGVRLGFRFERSRQAARDATDRLVEGHMHLAFAATEHREYMYVGPSSEPILAEAAAQLMHRHCMHFESAMLVSRWCDEGLLPKGDRGELVVRLLLTLAHDRAIQLSAQTSIPTTLWPRKPHPVLSFSRPILLPDFLNALLGGAHAKTILDSRPDNIPNGLTLGESALGSAQLNFTHWGKAGDSSVVSDQAAWVALGRCMAWQCSDGQKDIDHITPLLLWDKKLGRYSTSAIFWQTKNRHEPQKVNIDAERLGFFTPHKDRDDPANSRPYLAIVVNLGVKARVSKATQRAASAQLGVTTLASGRFSSRGVKKLPQHPRYAVTISGCTHISYPGVVSRSDAGTYSALLSSLEWFDDHARQDKDFLEEISSMKPVWLRPGTTSGSYKEVVFEPESCLQKQPTPKSRTKAAPVEVQTYRGAGSEMVEFGSGLDEDEDEDEDDEDEEDENNEDENDEDENDEGESDKEWKGQPQAGCKDNKLDYQSDQKSDNFMMNEAMDAPAYVHRSFGAGDLGGALSPL